jgi:hypothetical protein
MTDRVHAAVHAMKAAGSHPARNATCADSGPEELLERDHSVLSPGHPTNDRLGNVALLPHTGNKSTMPGFRPPSPGRGRT